MDSYQATIREYYSALVGGLPTTDNVSIICVAHTVANSPQFVRALSRVGKVAVVMAKSQSYESPDRKLIENTLQVPVIRANRDAISAPASALALLRRYCAKDAKIIIADVGGYFAPTVGELAAESDLKLVGVLEGTENGHKRYEKVPQDHVPVVSVARSPLKDAEDHLVGAGVVFSVEAVLRQMTQLLQGRNTCVVGFGKIGAGVAAALRGRGLPTAVCEANSIRRAVAAAHGYEVYGALDSQVLSRFNLIISATGNRAITTSIAHSALPGTVFASVTSADDELDFTGISDLYTSSEVVPGVHEYLPKTDGPFFFLINGGNSANFLHGAVEGPALELINGEKVAAIAELAAGSFMPTAAVQVMSEASRRLVADTWASYFVPGPV